MDFLPDTNIIINFFQNKEPDRTFLQTLGVNENLFISPVVIAEVRPQAPYLGKDELQKFISSGTVIPIDLEIGILAGDYRREFIRKTKRTYLIDCLIAATCKLHNLILATNNVKDYPMKDIKILKP